MTASIKSVLFVDYDSLYLGLRARDPVTARRFASRPDLWIEALEAGQLHSGSDGDRRRTLMRVCYADPKLFGKARAGFAAQGFQIVDSLPLPGRERNAAEIQLVLDAVDALAHPTAFDEFILLAADTDLTPLLLRLRSHNRATTIYSTATTSPIYRSIADASIEEGRFAQALAAAGSVESPEEGDDTAAGAAAPGDLASFARRIHQATNVPLFPPKVYVELFRALASEIAENGYHFQSTAEHVVARLVASGRAVSRRQVAFVVKGLALKGHVFSDSDTPERLAEVFREQVLYLARHAGLEVDDTVEHQIQRWIASHGSREDTAPAAEPAASPEEPSAETEIVAEEPASEESPPPLPATSDVQAGAIPAASEAPAEEVIAATPEDAPAKAEELVPVQPMADAAIPPVRPERREAAAESRRAPPVMIAAPAAPAAAAPPVIPPPVAPMTLLPGEAFVPPILIQPETKAADLAGRGPIAASLITAIAEAVEAAKPAAEATKTGAASKPGLPDPKSAEADKARTAEPTPPADDEATDDLDEAGELEEMERLEALPASPSTSEPPGDDGDIGDEIQRILAAYTQSRRPAGPGQ